MINFWTVKCRQNSLNLFIFITTLNEDSWKYRLTLTIICHSMVLLNNSEHKFLIPRTSLPRIQKAFNSFFKNCFLMYTKFDLNSYLKKWVSHSKHMQLYLWLSFFLKVANMYKCTVVTMLRYLPILYTVSIL